MVWLGTSKNDLTTPIIFKPRETLSNKNYIDVVLRYAQSEGKPMESEPMRSMRLEHHLVLSR